jgi:hypothetical protein
MERPIYDQRRGHDEAFSGMSTRRSTATSWTLGQWTVAVMPRKE